MGETLRGYVGNYDLLKQPLGQKTTIPLIGTKPVDLIQVRPHLNLTLAGGAASGAVVNRGSVMAAIRALHLSDSGASPDTICDGRVLRVFDEMMVPRSLSSFTRLASGAAATSDLAETAALIFGIPNLFNRRETFYEAHRQQGGQPRKLELLVETVPAIKPMFLDAVNDRVLTVNAFDVDVRQRVDSVDNPKLSLFCPVYRQVGTFNLPGNVKDQVIAINSDQRILALVVQQTAGDVEVQDIITDLLLRSDRREIVQKTPVGILNDSTQFDFGGSFPIAGYQPFLFADNGRWGNAIIPARDPNLRFVFNGGNSATAGLSQVRIWAIELWRFPGAGPLPAAVAG